ncbi:ethanolamine ammonia-lyase subunit EutC [Celeribacter halophilus]|uniref:ethanolamine ammonia-lyase subunit EutC n=1 Tax=Celeribacter halophilus TaxID=576117 RepID=UPI003A935857
MDNALENRLGALMAMTPSRVRLDGNADALPLKNLLSFQEDHAAARDAIYTPLDSAALQSVLQDVFDVEAQCLSSRAIDRAEYLKRPDLGRMLAQETQLEEKIAPLAIVIADGLSPLAAMTHSVQLVAALRACCPLAQDAPVYVVEQGRVAIGDAIGQMTGAQMVLVLIGERPGLTVSDSLGAYLTWAPKIGTRDSARNCVSNIHANGGLSYAAAAARIHWLVAAAQKVRFTGVGLKDNSPVAGNTMFPTLN